MENNQGIDVVQQLTQIQNENESVKTNAVNYLRMLKKCLDELMGYLSRACLGDLKLRESLSNFYFEYKCFVENINKLLNVYADSVTQKFDQVSFSKFNLNINDKMVKAKLKKSKQLNQDEEIIKELNEAIKNASDGTVVKQHVNLEEKMHILRKMNPFFNDFNNFEELGSFKDLIDCLIDSENLLREQNLKKNKKGTENSDSDTKEYKDLISDINDKENQYSVDLLMKLKVEHLIEFYTKQYGIDKENQSKFERFGKHFLCPNCNKNSAECVPDENIRNFDKNEGNQASAVVARDQSKFQLKDLLEDFQDCEVNNSRLSLNILDTKLREKTFKDKVETMKAETNKLVSDLSRAKENLERQQVKVLLQEKKQNDITMKVRFYEEKTHKFKEDNLKKAALLIELEKKKLNLSKQYQKDVVFDDELNNKLSISVPPWKS